MKKEQQDRLARSANGYTAHDGSAAPTYHGHTSAYIPRGRGAYNNAYRGGPQRGGYTYRGRGAASYHPYQRPPPSHGPTKFKNRTAVFNKPDVSAAVECPLETEQPTLGIETALRDFHIDRYPK
jgi:hypothetical protein